MRSLIPIGQVTKQAEKRTSGGVLQIGDHAVKSWCKTQTVIALSSGEAGPYATNMGAAQALGLQSLLRDLGVRLDLKLFTDSSTAKAIIQRTGLGKIRHLDANELWRQQKAKDREIVHQNIKHVLNVADILTKAQDLETIRGIMELMGHRHGCGRSMVAPDLNNIDDVNTVASYVFHKHGQLCYSA